MRVSASRVVLLLSLVLLTLGVGFVVGANHPLKTAPAVTKTSFQRDMDANCTAKLHDSFLKLSSDGRKGQTDQAFFSWNLHTCVEVEVTLDSKDAGTMNYLVSDLTFGFVAPPKWHHTEQSLHIYESDTYDYHHLNVEGYWAPVSSDPGKQLVSDANVITLTCDYNAARGMNNDANTCTETEGYTQFGSIEIDTQTYHIASWSRDEVVATDAKRGMAGATASTLLIHPEANEIEIIDRYSMDEKQPILKSLAGKSYGDQYELHGGMYILNTQNVFFQCDEDGVVTDMRFDVVKNHHGDVVNVPPSEWNAGLKANHKFTSQECNSAMQKELEKLF